MQIRKKESLYRHFVNLLGLLLLAGIFQLLVPLAAVAEPSNSVEITGDGVATPVTFTLEQLQAMKQYQHVYSTINTWPTKKWYVGEGVTLRSLLALAGLKQDARMMTFTSADGYVVTLTVKELLMDRRFYFPHLMENSANDGSVPGSPAYAIEVEPILALKSIEGSDNPDNMNDMDALLLMCGQRAVTEQTNNIYLKYVSKIEVTTAPPPKWDNPGANVSSGTASAGTLVELTNKRNDADKIYYTTDGTTPTVNSPIFNWSAKRWWGQRPDSLKNINKPIELTKDTVIKAITIGPGREDSDVVTFSYQIGNPDNAAKEPGGLPTAVTLDEDLVNLKVGSIVELGATVGPDNAIDKRVTWSSSDTRVATVDNNGLVTVVGPGTVTITVKTVAGNLMATCTVKGTREIVKGASAVPDDTNLKDELQEAPAQKQVGAAAQQETSDPTTASDVPRATVEVQVPNANWRYLAKKESAAEVPEQPNTRAGQIFEVSLGTIPLQLPIDRSSYYTAIIFLFLFLFGAIRKYREYIKEVVC